MPLSIQNATANWTLAGQLAAPSSGQQAGAGGPVQANAASLILANATASWVLVPLVPTAAQLSPSLGAAQAYASGLVLANAGASWILSTLAQPKVTAQRGAGGASQGFASSLIVVAPVSWTLASRLFAASFNYTLAPDGFTILATSTSGDAPDAYTWEWGDATTGAGPTPTHIFSAFGSFTVVLRITRLRGFENAPLTSTTSRVVTISLVAQPDESLDDVLNLEAGFHAYEPLRTSASDVGENVSFFNEVLNLPPGQLASLLFFAPSQTIRVRQVTATGSGDGLFKLLLNGQVIDVKRSYATHRNIRFDLEQDLKLTVNDSLEIRVTNTSALSASYDGALLGRTIS